MGLSVVCSLVSLRGPWIPGAHGIDLGGLDPADFDHLLTELKRRSHLEGTLTPDMVLDEVGDFIPSDIARQREYQELLAVLECTSRELLPERYAQIPREVIQQRVREIRTSMGML